MITSPVSESHLLLHVHRFVDSIQQKEYLETHRLDIYKLWGLQSSGL